MHPGIELQRLPMVVRGALLWSVGWFATATLLTALVLDDGAITAVFGGLAACASHRLVYR